MPPGHNQPTARVPSTASSRRWIWTLLAATRSHCLHSEAFALPRVEGALQESTRLETALSDTDDLAVNLATCRPQTNQRTALSTPAICQIPPLHTLYLVHVNVIKFWRYETDTSRWCDRHCASLTVQPDNVYIIDSRIHHRANRHHTEPARRVGRSLCVVRCIICKYHATPRICVPGQL